MTTQNANAPDYECRAYQDQKAAWQLVCDIKEGLAAIRANKERYLPRFESEAPQDWGARVLLTFYNNYYAPTLSDDVGLVFAEEPVLQKDVPPAITQLLDDVDGRGAKWTVFARDAFEGGLHWGHGAIWTDMPPVSDGARANLLAFERAQNRPYMTFLAANEIVSWRTVVIGGVERIVRFVRKEETMVPDGAFGEKAQCQYRVYRQEVETDQSGRPAALGAISWQLWQPKQPDAPRDGQSGVEYVPTDAGPLTGPKRLPLRVFYGGERLGVLHSRPFLYSLAQTSIEETQVGSDYAAVMHRCNVPTPWFAGLNPGEKVNMSQGISLPADASCGYLEPKGTALAETRARLEAIRQQLARLGATILAGDLVTQGRMTATQAAQVARQRNARLLKAVQSFEDAYNGALEDMAAFIPVTKGEGGTIVMNREFAGAVADPLFIDQVGKAYDRGAVTLDEYRYAIRHGELPDDADPAATAAILAELERAKLAAEAEAAAKQRAQFAAMSGGGTGGGNGGNGGGGDAGGAGENDGEAGGGEPPAVAA